VTVQDVDVALKIWGKNVTALKGKTVIIFGTRKFATLFLILVLLQVLLRYETVSESPK
jgi:hypothetical protein